MKLRPSCSGSASLAGGVGYRSQAAFLGARHCSPCVTKMGSPSCWAFRLYWSPFFVGLKVILIWFQVTTAWFTAPAAGPDSEARPLNKAPVGIPASRAHCPSGSAGGTIAALALLPLAAPGRVVAVPSAI